MKNAGFGPRFFMSDPTMDGNASGPIYALISTILPRPCDLLDSACAVVSTAWPVSVPLVDRRGASDRAVAVAA